MFCCHKSRSQDYLDHRYHARRALYLAGVARVLSRSGSADANGNCGKEGKKGTPAKRKTAGAAGAGAGARAWKCNWGALSEDPRKPCLLVTSKVRVSEQK